jgi:hypothetical protein
VAREMLSASSVDYEEPMGLAVVMVVDVELRGLR